MGKKDIQINTAPTKIMPMSNYTYTKNTTKYKVTAECSILNITVSLHTIKNSNHHLTYKKNEAHNSILFLTVLFIFKTIMLYAGWLL